MGRFYALECTKPFISRDCGSFAGRCRADSHGADEASDDALKNGIGFGDRFGWAGREKGWLREVVITGEGGLAVVEDEGQVLVFEGAKFDKEMVVFEEAEFFPLIGVDTMKEGSPWLMGNLLK
jgi:hypothetical protein